MRPETQAFIDNAQGMLRRAHVMMGFSLYEDARRTAYMAAFHAAQALIFEREQRVMKSHHGVQSEFHRLVREGIARRLSGRRSGSSEVFEPVLP